MSGAPSGKPALAFSKGDKFTITELKEENGRWYALETGWSSLWFPLSSTGTLSLHSFTLSLSVMTIYTVSTTFLKHVITNNYFDNQFFLPVVSLSSKHFRDDVFKVNPYALNPKP